MFDVYPIRGHIDKNTTIKTSFTFYAYGSKNIFGQAICHIIGGPEYKIDLTGSSTDVSFKIDPEYIDFGYKCFTEPITTSIELKNLSQDPLTFDIIIPESCSFKEFTIHPLSGVIPYDSFIMLSLRIVTDIPKEYKENFLIKLGTIYNAEVNIVFQSIVPQLQINMIRSSDDINLASLHKF